MSVVARLPLNRLSMAAPSASLAVRLLMALLMFSAAAVAGDTANPVPVAVTDETRFVVYFGNDQLASDPGDCTAVFPVERSAPKTVAVATAALEALFNGPTPAERQAGYHSFFSSNTTGLLKGLRVTDGTAYVDLRDMRAALSGATSSCGAAELRTQIERTLLQFPTVARVIYAIDGDPRTFYEWMNEPCDETNDRCDPLLFRTQR